jgi:hypothetical protein
MFTQLTAMKANDADLSNPSVWKDQSTFICGQIGVLDANSELATIKKCSPDLNRYFTDTQKRCKSAGTKPGQSLTGLAGISDDSVEPIVILPDTGGKNEPSAACNSVAGLVRLHSACLRLFLSLFI